MMHYVIVYGLLVCIVSAHSVMLTPIRVLWLHGFMISTLKR